jgi:PAS domain-containing protein
LPNKRCCAGSEATRPAWSAATAILNAAGIIEGVNPATERIFGYGPAELIGHNVKLLMPDNYRVEHDAYLSNYLNSGVKKIIGIGREVLGFCVMRLAVLLLSFSVANAAAADALTSDSTGATWAESDLEAHRAWAKQYGSRGADGQDTLWYDLSWNLIEHCLDQITADDDGNVPSHVATKELPVLTAWCKQETDKSIARIRAEGPQDGMVYVYPK